MNTTKTFSGFTTGQSVIWTDFDGDFGELGLKYEAVITGKRHPAIDQGYECYYLTVPELDARIEALDHEIEDGSAKGAD